MENRDSGVFEITNNFEVLNQYRDFLATDPRDKVYGFQGLVDTCHLDECMAVDYQRPRFKYI
jgi:hypothetical protein